MAGRLTKAIEEGKSPPMIVVYVNGMIRSGYVDTANGKWPVETVTIKELIPHIDVTYRTIARREGRSQRLTRQVESSPTSTWGRRLT